jgi:hypothetical protein
MHAGEACCECGGGVIELPSAYRSRNVTAPDRITTVRYKRALGVVPDSHMGCGISFHTDSGQTFVFRGGCSQKYSLQSTFSSQSTRALTFENVCQARNIATAQYAETKCRGLRRRAT